MAKKSLITASLLILVFKGFYLECAFSQSSNPFPGVKNKYVYQFDTILYKNGDSIDWRNLKYNDKHWETRNPFSAETSYNGIFWYRKRILVDSNLTVLQKPNIGFRYLQSAYEVYWDGKLVGYNGIIGKDKESEKPGVISYSCPVEKSMFSKGEHLLALRVSNIYAEKDDLGFIFEISDSETLPVFSLYEAQQLFFIGVFLTAFFIGLSLFIGGGRYKPYLIFSIICLATLLWRISNFYNYYSKIGYAYQTWMEDYQMIIVSLIELLIIVFLLVNYKIPKKLLHISIAFVLSFILKYFIGIYLFSWTIIPYTLGIIVYVIWQKKAGGVIILIGYLIFCTPILLDLILHYLPFYINMSAFVVFVLAIIISISKQIREQNQKFIDSEIKLNRLSNEILKKTIQPHFIINTLNSVKSWLKIHPEKGENLIQALANEFRLIEKISNEKEIPIERELELCNYHLDIMGYRRDAEYQLNTLNIKNSVMIPPLIFHTLIENGITHSYKPKEKGGFLLEYSENQEKTVFVLKNNGSLIKTNQELVDTEIKEGLGTKYVKTRLEESYPGKWELEYGINNENWEVKITIKK